MLRLCSDRSLLLLLALLALLGSFLVTTSVPGVFIADENQYVSFALAARQGEVKVPGMAGLPPARGLSFFSPTDPTPRPVPANFRVPIAYGVSPLHAFLAAPLTYLGWKGLVALNAFGLCLAAVFAFLLARRFAVKASTPWIAVGVLLLASFSVEYAQGVWPHMLSAGLCMGGVYFASSYRERGAALDAAIAGLLVGLAFGVRLQALLFVALVGLGLVLLSRSRWRAAAFYALGLALPLLACSFINHEARGLWNPISRGSGYVSFRSGGFDLHPIAEWSISLWARVVDYSVYPELPGIFHGYLTKEPFSGATLVAGSFKKAWLQSAPWVAVPLLALIASWLRPSTRATQRDERATTPRRAIASQAPVDAHDTPPGIGRPASIASSAFQWLRLTLGGDGRGRELRGLAIVVFGVLVAVATRGLMRDDGLAFNQRYLLDLMPIVAVTLAWAVEPLDLRPLPLVVGATFGAALWSIVYWALPIGLGLLLIMKIPLFLAAASLAGWALIVRGRVARWAAPALAACLAWAISVHLVDDLGASRNLRRSNLAKMAALDPELRDGDALFAFWGEKDAFGPLQMDRDLLIIDSSPDEAETLAHLTRALLQQGRRVFVLPNLPRDKLQAMSKGLEVRELGPFEVGADRPALRLLHLYEPEQRAQPGVPEEQPL